MDIYDTEKEKVKSVRGKNAHTIQGTERVAKDSVERCRSKSIFHLKGTLFEEVVNVIYFSKTVVVNVLNEEKEESHRDEEVWNKKAYRRGATKVRRRVPRKVSKVAYDIFLVLLSISITVWKAYEEGIKVNGKVPIDVS